MTTENLKLRSDFLRYLKLQRGANSNTIDAYEHDVDKLLNFLEQEGAPSWKRNSKTFRHLQHSCTILASDPVRSVVS